MMTLEELTKAILQQYFAPTAAQDAFLRDEVLSQPAFYIIAAPNTSQTQWAQKKFAALILDDKTLPLLLSQPEAEDYAKKAGCVLPDGQPLVVKADRTAIAKIVAEYDDSQLIDIVKIYTRPPIHVSLEPAAFFADAAILKSVPSDTDAAPSSLIGIDAVKKALDTFEKNARRQLDPGGRFENIHTLVETLIQQNRISPEKMDKMLGFPENFTRKFCQEANNDHNKDIISKYLSFFGLEAYLYCFRRNSTEIQRYLSAHKTIDAQKIKASPSLNAERFTLRSITRGLDGAAYVYRIELVSKKTGSPLTLVISDPLDPALVIGRDYHLLTGRGEPRDEDKHALKPGDAVPMPSEEELQRIAAGYDTKKGPQPQRPAQKPQRSYEDLRKDAIIAFIKQQYACNSTMAGSKYKNIETEPDLLEDFYQYIIHGQWGKLEVQGYTARKLIKELRFKPYDAYLSLVELRTHPQETKQRLKYRETDPQ